MTIKRRLFISNILMIVIPIAAYMAFAGVTSGAIVLMYKNAALPLPSETCFEAVLAGYMPQIAALWLSIFILTAAIVLITSYRLTHIITKTIVTPRTRSFSA
jgi:hypothetical protein